MRFKIVLAIIVDMRHAFSKLEKQSGLIRTLPLAYLRNQITSLPEKNQGLILSAAVIFKHLSCSYLFSLRQGLEFYSTFSKITVNKQFHNYDIM